MLTDKELFSLIENGSTKELEVLLEGGLDIDFYGDDGLSPFGFAIMNDNANMADLLYDYSSVYAMKTQYCNYGAMEMAVHFKSPQCILQFLNRGLDFYQIEMKYFSFNFHNTLYQWKNEHDVLLDAVKEGNLDKVKQYSHDYVYLAQKTQEGHDALFLAFYCKKPDRKAIFEHLMGTPIYKNHMDLEGCYLAQHLTQYYDTPDCEQMLDLYLSHPDVDINFMSYRKNEMLITPFIKYGNIAAIEKYLPKMDLEKMEKHILRHLGDLKMIHSKSEITIETCDKVRILLPILKEQQIIEKTMLSQTTNNSKNNQKLKI